MAEIVFKTYPRIFPFGIFLIGTFFMGAFAWLTFPDLMDVFNSYTFQVADVVILLCFSFFLLASTTCFYYFVTNKTIWISKDKLILNYFFLPFKKKIAVEDVYGLSQTTKEVRDSTTDASPSYIFKDVINIIKRKSGKAYKTNSLVKSEFALLMKHFAKSKYGKTYIKQDGSRMSSYLLNSLDGLFWLVVLTVLIVGLVYNLINR